MSTERSMVSHDPSECPGCEKCERMDWYCSCSECGEPMAPPLDPEDNTCDACFDEAWPEVLA